MRDALPYLMIVLFLLLSAFFSGSEIAFATASAPTMRRWETSEKRTRRLAAWVFRRYDDALVSILIGNNLVNIASSSVATVIAVSLMGDEGAWLATGLMTVIILTFGEIIPKILASRRWQAFTCLSAPPLRGLMVVLWPLVWLIEKGLNGVSVLWRSQQNRGPAYTEDDLETMLDAAEDEGVVDEDTADLLQSALNFDDVLAYEVITPRVDLTAIDADDPLEKQMSVIFASPYSRLPVYEDSVDHILGILHLNLFLREVSEGKTPNIRQMLLPVHFVHKTMPLPDVLKLMKKEKCHMVVVTDEYGGTMGVVTMEDVLEQLVGDIWDESDVVEEEMIPVDETTWDVDGDMRIYDLFEELDVDDRDFDDDNATVGGWAIEMMGDYPKPGDSFTYKNLTVTVQKMEGLRVLRLRVRVEPEPEEEDGEKE